MFVFLLGKRALHSDGVEFVLDFLGEVDWFGMVYMGKHGLELLHGQSNSIVVAAS